MERIAKFEYVSDSKKTVPLPVRATSGSAGYDIKTPVDIYLRPGETAIIDTELRCKIADGWVLLIMPKSGLGFKYRAQLDNTVGVIDSDYYYADNEGRIMIKLTNDSKLSDSNHENIMHVEKGKAFCQGIFFPFGITVDDIAKGERHGGFGSTNA